MINRFLRKSGSKEIVNDKKRLELSYEKLLPMDEWYMGENIHYADYLERIEQYQVFPYQGRLFDSHGGPINSTTLDFDTGGILVMNQQGVLFFAHKERGKIHHSTFLASDPVAYACMVEVQDGKIIDERVWSGHYQPTVFHQRQFHDRLTKDFTINLKSDLTMVFLVKNLFHQFEEKCAISNQPLLDPIKLPCGHFFNKKPLAQWSEKYKVCPFDDKPFEISELISDENENKVKFVQEHFARHLNDTISCNANLDKRVISLRLDDRGHLTSKVSTVANRKGVFLFLKSNSRLERIGKIARKLGIFSPPKDRFPYKNPRYCVFGREYHESTPLSEIENREKEIPSIYLFLS